MFRWIGVVCVLIMGISLGANFFASHMTPPPPTLTGTMHSRSAPTVAPAPPRPSTPEEQLAGLKLKEQEERTFRWERGWLRLETVDVTPARTRVEMSVYLQEGTDVFYVEPEGTLLVAGPWTGTATRSTFPDFKIDREHLASKGTQSFVYARELQRDARHRVSVRQETPYALEFASIAVVPQVLDVKVRFVHVRTDLTSGLLIREGRLWGDDVLLASCRWDTRLRQEIAALETKVRAKGVPLPAVKPETKARRVVYLQLADN
jgi:hypothetical protein